MAAVKNDYPRLPDRLDCLGRLTENLWWSWNPAEHMIFKSLDRQAWKDSIHNPDKMLREIPADILERAAGNDAQTHRELHPAWEVLHALRSCKGDDAHVDSVQHHAEDDQGDADGDGLDDPWTLVQSREDFQALLAAQS